MHVVFHHSDKPREVLLADAFAAGVRVHGDTSQLQPLTADKTTLPCEVAVMVGVKSRDLYQAYYRQGTHVIYMDKGYTRASIPGPVKVWEYWRVSLDEHHPTEHLTKMAMPYDRADALGLVLKPWRRDGRRIILAGSSQKYHDFYGLRHPTDWARKVVRQIREVDAKREIVYRPKPSWKEATPIEGTTFCREGDIYDLLTDAWCLVTHGSNAVFEAILEGVPCIVLGNAVAKPISSTTLKHLPFPDMRSYAVRHQWLANLAYWQWTMPEMMQGAAWAFLRPKIFGA